MKKYLKRHVPVSQNGYFTHMDFYMRYGINRTNVLIQEYNFNVSKYILDSCCKETVDLNPKSQSFIPDSCINVVQSYENCRADSTLDLALFFRKRVDFVYEDIINQETKYSTTRYRF
ncbi:hypothetical protein RF11_04096 [Thelohanellus kitauei]|uniref:Uncharacterized protein n=1 Tax=Thelohanellus kitauei TaxID=669202 RepID=A0A0C2MN76_THEKT|nr:hypothetical protein RF11_04096 [Thelohanellus kitauei]